MLVNLDSNLCREIKETKRWELRRICHEEAMDNDFGAPNAGDGRIPEAFLIQRYEKLSRRVCSCRLEKSFLELHLLNTTKKHRYSISALMKSKLKMKAEVMMIPQSSGWHWMYRLSEGSGA
jgi:hypothetical protein